VGGVKLGVVMHVSQDVKHVAEIILSILAQANIEFYVLYHIEYYNGREFLLLAQQQGRALKISCYV